MSLRVKITLLKIYKILTLKSVLARCNLFRYQKSACATGSGYYVQPQNISGQYYSYCYPNGTFHSNSVCGSKFLP